MVATNGQLWDSEAQLIARVLEGNREVFCELVSPYAQDLFLVARSVRETDAEAEQAVQETVLKAFQNLENFRTDCNFRRWLLRITVSEARRPMPGRSGQRRFAADSGRGAAEYTPAIFEDWREIPVERLQTPELRQTLRDALNSLPPSYREVLVLRDVEKFTTAETTDILGITEAEVKARLHGARLQMRDALAQASMVRARIADMGACRRAS